MYRPSFPTGMLLLLALSVLSVSCTTVSPRMFSSLRTETPTNPVAEPTYYEKKYGFYDGVYLAYEDISEHSGTSSSEWTYSQSIRRKYLVLKPEAESMSTFTFTLSSDDSLHAVSLHITSPDGTVQSFDKNNLVRKADSDSTLTVRFAYPSIVRGSIVEEQIEILAVDPVRDMPISWFRWLELRLPCEQFHVVYAYPAWWGVSLKELLPGKYPNVTARRDSTYNKIVLEYKSQNIDAFSDEPYAPFRAECTPYVSLLVDSLKMDGENFNRVDSWDLYARVVKKRYMDRYPFINAIFPIWPNQVNTTARRLTVNSADNLARLDTIVRYLQNTIEPNFTADDMSFSDVLEEKKGSPFLITGLAQAMLHEVGIPSLYLRIHSAERGYFDRDFFSGAETDIPALRVTLDHKDYIVFPYIRHMPINYLPAFCLGQPAMRVDPKEGFIGLLDLPESTAEQQQNSRNYTIEINDDGLMTVQEDISLTGAAALALRRTLDHKNEDELREAIRSFISYNDGDITVLESRVENQGMPLQPLVLHCTYTIDNLVTITPDEVIVRTEGLLSPATEVIQKTDLNRRRLPVRIYANEEYIKDILLLCPASWQLQSRPKNIDISNRFGNRSTQYSQEGSRLHIRHQRLLQRTLQPADTYGELLDLVGEKTGSGVPALIFTRQ